MKRFFLVSHKQRVVRFPS